VVATLVALVKCRSALDLHACATEVGAAWELTGTLFCAAVGSDKL
jgi:hypothetical protein